MNLFKYWRNTKSAVSAALRSLFLQLMLKIYLLYLYTALEDFDFDNPTFHWAKFWRGALLSSVLLILLEFLSL